MLIALIRRLRTQRQELKLQSSSASLLVRQTRTGTVRYLETGPCTCFSSTFLFSAIITRTCNSLEIFLSEVRCDTPCLFFACSMFVLRIQTDILPEHKETFVEYWRNNRTKVHEVLTKRSSWSGTLQVQSENVSVHWLSLQTVLACVCVSVKSA